MRVLDLFSGIGGFSLGLHEAGMETVGFCEMDPFCQKVLKKHWPNVPIHADIKELDGHEYRGAAQLVCGGFPCQPYSVAGQQRGAEDDRALWPEMLRVIREVQPTWVIGENVTGIVAMELDTVLSDLEGEGYSCQTFVIPACAVDAPHKRDRCWLISYNDVADTNGYGIQGGKVKRSDGENRPRSSHEQPSGCSRSAIRLRNAKRETFWEPEPGMGRVAHGVPDRTHRLKGLGNAVVPSVVAEIGRVIMHFHENGIDPRG